MWGRLINDLRDDHCNANKQTGGDQVVSALAFYSDDPSSNPTEAYNFSGKFVFEKNENKQNRGRGWPIFTNKRTVKNKLLT